MNDIELAIVDAYRAGLKKGILEYATWKDGQEVVGIMRRPLLEVLAAVDAIPDNEILQGPLYKRYSWLNKEKKP